MATEVSNIREAFNRVDVYGTLFENKLVKEEYTDKENNTKNRIRGSIVVQYAPNCRIKVHYYANEFTSKGEESKSYSNLSNFIEESKSISECVRDGDDPDTATVVSVMGKIGAYDYYNKNKDEMMTAPQIKASFITRVKPEEVDQNKYGVTYNVEMYFENIEREKVDDKETARVVVDGIIPIYGGNVMPIRMYTTDDTEYGDIGQYLLDNFENGKTGQVNGVVQVVVTQVARAGFGRPSANTFENSKTEYVIVGGSASQYAVTDPKHYDKKSIKAAMLHRAEVLESRKAEEKKRANGENTNPRGFTSAPTVAKPVEEVDF